MSVFRIGTWNCRMGIDRKRAAVERLGCDVLIVPECAKAPALASQPDVSFEWKGRLSNKGLGVFGFRGWRLRLASEANPLPWVLPLHLIDPCGSDADLLLAIWTVANRAERWPSYSGQVSEAITAWETPLKTGTVVIAGDLNCAAQGTSQKPHRENITRLEALGASSAYHAHRGVQHGAEQEMTLRWFGPGSRAYLYHCDFIFLSRIIAARLQTVEVGSMAEWVESGLSDHAPVVANLEAN